MKIEYIKSVEDWSVVLRLNVAQRINVQSIIPDSLSVTKECSFHVGILFYTRPKDFYQEKYSIVR